VKVRGYILLGAVTLYALLLWALLRPAGGLPGAYFSRGPDGAEILVHRRIDPGIEFRVPQRLEAAYLFHWDVRRWGVPEERPPYLIRWGGLLVVPRNGRHGFMVDVQGEAGLRIDGIPVALRPDSVTERELQEGLHPIELDYASPEGDARVVLLWKPPGGSLRPIPSANLAADQDAIDRGRTRRLAGWLLLAAGGVAGLIGWVSARRAGGTTGGRAAWSATDRSPMALGAILLLAALLRFHDYALVPFHHETADEYQHAWEGWHLLHEGVPVSWSFFSGSYPPAQVRHLLWFGHGYVLVRPYFDHPPLFSILVGLVNSVAGAPTFLSCTLPAMRLVPIILSLAGILLLYRLALHYGASERGALLAALVYAVLPVIVLSHRLVKAESLLSLLFMGVILAVGRYEGSGRARDAALVGLLCGLSIWTKATGVAVVVTAVVLLVSRRRYRGAALVLLMTAGFLGLYLVYAWAYDFGIFLEVVRAQSTVKWASFESLLELLRGKVVDLHFGGGLYLWLLLSAGVVAFRKERALLLPLAIYASLMVLTADFRVIYGWYRIPLYPFLCVAAGIYLEEMVEASDLSRTFPFAITALATGLIYSLPSAYAQSKPAVALFAVVAVVPYVVRLAHERPATVRGARVATHVLVALFLLSSLAADRNLLEIYSAMRGTR
jgi:4-amino-4-deoxy-L-arabinose transferase-like glycosyltransferase